MNFTESLKSRKFGMAGIVFAYVLTTDLTEQHKVGAVLIVLGIYVLGNSITRIGDGLKR